MAKDLSWQPSGELWAIAILAIDQDTLGVFVMEY